MSSKTRKALAQSIAAAQPASRTSSKQNRNPSPAAGAGCSQGSQPRRLQNPSQKQLLQSNPSVVEQSSLGYTESAATDSIDMKSLEWPTENNMGPDNAERFDLRAIAAMQQNNQSSTLEYDNNDRAAKFDHQTEFDSKLQMMHLNEIHQKFQTLATGSMDTITSHKDSRSGSVESQRTAELGSQPVNNNNGDNYKQSLPVSDSTKNYASQLKLRALKHGNNQTKQLNQLSSVPLASQQFRSLTNSSEASQFAGYNRDLYQASGIGGGNNHQPFGYHTISTGNNDSVEKDRAYKSSIEQIDQLSQSNGRDSGQQQNNQNEVEQHQQFVGYLEEGAILEDLREDDISYAYSQNTKNNSQNMSHFNQSKKTSEIDQMAQTRSNGFFFNVPKKNNQERFMESNSNTSYQSQSQLSSSPCTQPSYRANEQPNNDMIKVDQQFVTLSQVQNDRQDHGNCSSETPSSYQQMHQNRSAIQIDRTSSQQTPLMMNDSELSAYISGSNQQIPRLTQNVTPPTTNQENQTTPSYSGYQGQQTMPSEEQLTFESRSSNRSALGKFLKDDGSEATNPIQIVSGKSGSSPIHSSSANQQIRYNFNSSLGNKYIVTTTGLPMATASKIEAQVGISIDQYSAIPQQHGDPKSHIYTTEGSNTVFRAAEDLQQQRITGQTSCFNQMQSQETTIARASVISADQQLEQLKQSMAGRSRAQLQTDGQGLFTQRNEPTAKTPSGGDIQPMLPNNKLNQNPSNVQLKYQSSLSEIKPAESLLLEQDKLLFARAPQQNFLNDQNLLQSSDNNNSESKLLYSNSIADVGISEQPEIKNKNLISSDCQSKQLKESDSSQLRVSELTTNKYTVKDRIGKFDSYSRSIEDLLAAHDSEQNFQKSYAPTTSQFSKNTADQLKSHPVGLENQGNTIMNKQVAKSDATSSFKPISSLHSDSKQEANVPGLDQVQVQLLKSNKDSVSNLNANQGSSIGFNSLDYKHQPQNLANSSVNNQLQQSSSLQYLSSLSKTYIEQAKQNLQSSGASYQSAATENPLNQNSNGISSLGQVNQYNTIVSQEDYKTNLRNFVDRQAMKTNGYGIGNSTASKVFRERQSRRMFDDLQRLKVGYGSTYEDLEAMHKKVLSYGISTTPSSTFSSTQMFTTNSGLTRQI